MAWRGEVIFCNDQPCGTVCEWVYGLLGVAVLLGLGIGFAWLLVALEF